MTTFLLVVVTSLPIAICRYFQRLHPQPRTLCLLPSDAQWENIELGKGRKVKPERWKWWLQLLVGQTTSPSSAAAEVGDVPPFVLLCTEIFIKSIKPLFVQLRPEYCVCFYLHLRLTVNISFRIFSTEHYSISKKVPTVFCIQLHVRLLYFTIKIQYSVSS